MNREPSAILSALGVFLSSLAKLAVLLNLVEWDADQLAGITLVIDNALIVFGALLIRSQVTPIKSPALLEGTSVTVLDATGSATGGKTTV